MTEVIEKQNAARDVDTGMVGSGDTAMLKMGMVGFGNMADARVHAIACQDNPDINVVSLGCLDRFDDVPQMVNFQATVMAKCPDPKHCQQLEGEGEKPYVEGTHLYSGKSQVCRSAQHAGVLRESYAGYLVKLTYSSQRFKLFSGSQLNNITSKHKSYTAETDSYLIEYAEIECPQNAQYNLLTEEEQKIFDEKKEKEKSFVQIDQSITP